MHDFTPGPWQIREEERPSHRDVLVRGSDGQVVAWCGVTPSRGEVRPPGETRANARLIAEAPRMARHLCVLHEAVRRGEWNADLWDWLGMYMRGPVAEALVALGELPGEALDWDDNEPIDEIADQILDGADAICERPPPGDGPTAGGEGQQP